MCLAVLSWPPVVHKEREMYYLDNNKECLYFVVTGCDDVHRTREMDLGGCDLPHRCID